MERLADSHRLAAASAALAALLLAGCTVPVERAASPERPVSAHAVHVVGDVRVVRVDAPDDLLSAGLGYAGLRAMTPPAFANPASPTPAELRRLAYYANWRGIADLTPGGGSEAVFPQLPMIAGEEHQALLRLEGRRAPHRVVVQVPDGFDPANPCVVVAPASGSRGVYGAIAVAGPWALPRGCVLAMTDKGAGTGVFDPASATGTAVDGTRASLDDAALEFVARGVEAPRVGETKLALRHFHSQDNPEADWGLHVLQTARFALDVLQQRFPGHRFTPATTRVIAVAVSNGGAAVLKAAEQDTDGLLDAVVAGEPQITAPRATPLFDVATEAALYQPCALLDPRLAGTPFNNPQTQAVAAKRCGALAQAGLLDGGDVAAMARDAYDRLAALGFDRHAMAEAGLNTAFDLWRAIAVGYASAYARTPYDAMPCGYGYAQLDAAGVPMAASPTVLTTWWAAGPGVPPALGIGLVDAMAAGDDSGDPAIAGLACLRSLRDGGDALALRLREGIDAIRASAMPRTRTLIVHGRGDGLVPVRFSSRPYVEAALANGASDLRYWEVENAQHFDAFLAVPDMFVRYVPMTPYVWQGLDQMVAWLDGGAAPMPSQVVRTRVRATSATIGAEQMGGLEANPGADAIVLANGTLVVPD